jgi:hypothetical protein
LGRAEVTVLFKEEENRIRRDECFLGESDFVMEVLGTSEKQRERNYRLKTQDVILESLERKVALPF